MPSGVFRWATDLMMGSLCNISITIFDLYDLFREMGMVLMIAIWICHYSVRSDILSEPYLSEVQPPWLSRTMLTSPGSNGNGSRSQKQLYTPSKLYSLKGLKAYMEHHGNLKSLMAIKSWRTCCIIEKHTYVRLQRHVQINK